MPVYNSQINRTDAQALIPEEVSSVMMQGIANESAALQMFTSVPMSTNQTRMPVLSALPVAYFVNADTGLKQTTEMAWANKFFNVEEIAAIVPIPEAVLDDASFDVWGSVRPRIEDAIARVLDAAIFFGTNKPASWPSAISVAAIAAANVITRGASTQAQGGVAQDINLLFSLVEGDGFSVDGVIANTTLRGLTRALRDTTGNRIEDVTPDSWWSVNDVRYPMRGLWPAGLSQPEAFVGDFSKGLLAVRQDITYKLLDQAVISDDAGAIVYNLAQQDMVAMRVVARYAFQVANPITYDQVVEASRYPFGVLRTPAS